MVASRTKSSLSPGNFLLFSSCETLKVLFRSWGCLSSSFCCRIPDTCKVREKMKYSGTKEAVKSAFVGISVNVNATDLSEVTKAGITEQCNKV